MSDPTEPAQSRICKTPGARYFFHITAISIAVSVRLPRELELEGLLDYVLVENGKMRDIRPQYEEILHDAMEAAVAAIIAQNKATPKAVFQYGRWRAPVVD